MKSGLLMQNLQFTGYMPDLSALRQRPAIVGTGRASVKVIAASRQVLVALAERPARLWRCQFLRHPSVQHPM